MFSGFSSPRQIAGTDEFQVEGAAENGGTPTPMPGVSEAPPVTTSPNRPSENGIFQVNVSGELQPSGRAFNLYVNRSYLSRNGRYLFVAVNEMSGISEFVDDPLFTTYGGYLLKIDLETNTKKAIVLTRKDSLRAGDFFIYNHNDLDVSPDGRYILLSTFDEKVLEGDEVNPVQEGGGIYLIDTESGAAQVLNTKPDGTRIRAFSARFLGGTDKIIFLDVDRNVAVMKDLVNNTVTDVINEPYWDFRLNRNIATADGNFLVISSPDNLEGLPNQPDNFAPQPYIYNLATGAAQLVSRDTDGDIPRNISGFMSISDDGKYVAFVSNQEDLDPNVSGPIARRHLYHHNVETRENTLVATARDREGYPTGVALDTVCISPNGRYIAYLRSSVWGPNRGAGKDRPWLIDTETGEEVDLSELIQDPELYPQDFSDNNADFSFSADNTKLTFISRRSGGVAYSSVFQYDIETGILRDVLTDLGIFQSADIRSFKGSADGTTVVFASNDRLLPELHEGVNHWRYGFYSVFLANIVENTLQEISLQDDGTVYPNAPNGHITESAETDISDDGNTSIFVSHFPLARPDPEALIGWTQHAPSDVFLKKRGDLTNIRASKDLAERESVLSVSISGDGNYVAFATRDWDSSAQQNLYVYDVVNDSQRSLPLPTPYNGDTFDTYVGLDLSRDGSVLTLVRQAHRSVNFSAVLVRSDILRFDLETGTWSNLTESGNSNSGTDLLTEVSDDGNLVLFSSAATNFDGRDANNAVDIYLYDSLDGSITLQTLLPDGSSSRLDSIYASLSGDGNYMTFSSRDTAFAGDDVVRDTRNVYVKDISSGEIRLVSKPSAQSDQVSSSDISQVTTDGTKILFRTFGGGVVAESNPYSTNVLLTVNPLFHSP